MKYQITHTTEYTYGESVPLCHNIVRLKPRLTERQTCLRHELIIAPEPALWRERMDYFGNHLTLFSLQEPHSSLTVTAVTEVDVSAACLVADRASVTWTDAVESLRTWLDPVTLDARQYLFDSPHVQRSAELAAFARSDFAAGRSLLESVTALNKRIFKEFKFVPGITSVHTSAAEVLRLKRGVCQDFAHLLIGGLRSLGLAARYVSGYLETHPSEGQTKLVGADASHAWVSVFIPDFGWVDFDPTNGVLPADQHVTLGWARDYDDVGPVKGVILGGQRHSLHVSVDVQRVEATDEDEPPVAVVTQSQSQSQS